MVPYLVRMREGDHPRIRGEHLPMDSPSLAPIGSSPHTRGAPSAYQCTTSRAGIIPAYAGSTARPERPNLPPEDHPRIRGEHMAAPMVRGVSMGSSPHTRGALVSHAVALEVSGIIPAYAGSTVLLATARSPCRDHPRIRGEHKHGGLDMVRRMGSSPHTRGAPRGAGPGDARKGIIPAYAGST